jgi:DNA/RNA endonuclease G (NUC1)/uncharacterized protein YjdB
VSVGVTPPTVTVQVDNTVSLAASALDANGQASPTTYTWSSSNDAVATVSATGIVTGIAVGGATITATSANGIAGTASVTVTAAPPPSASGIVISEILADPDVVPDAQGEWFEVFNSSAAAIDLQGWEIRSAKSTGPDETHVIASSVIVPAGGFAVIGNNANSATNGGVNVAYEFPNDVVTLSNGSNTEWLALHTASGATADSVAYSPRIGTVVVDPKFLPTLGVARELIDVTGDNSALSSSNWRDAVLRYGTGTNRGTPGYGAYGEAGPVARIVISPSPASVNIGGTRAMTAIALDALGRISNETLTWSSSDETTATIDASGIVSGIKEGSAVITATAASGASATTSLVVVDPDAPANISVGISDPGWMPVGFQRSVFSTVKTSDNRTVSSPLVYSVSDETILALDVFEGRTYVRGVGAGTAELRATAPNGAFGIRNVTILPATAPTSANYRNNVEFGTPTDSDPADDIIVTHPQYISSYNSLRGGPNWVSWNLNASHFGDAPRCECFSEDRSLPAGAYHENDVDYVNSGYNRGHMVQSESRTTTEQENAATFLLTNILPQAAKNNQVVWLGFENFLNDLARNQGKDVYIIAGGEYAANPPTLKNQGKVAIPDYTWKVAVVMPGGQGLANVTTPQSIQVYVVRMPNLVSTATDTVTWQVYQSTVDAVEAATGYDLLALLPDNIERIVEANDHAPVAGITGTYAGVEGSEIAFHGNATDIDSGDAVTFSWSFGDGSSAAGDAPTHTYADNGSYTATLIVTDSYGAADTTSTVVSVANAAPVVNAFDGATILEGETYTSSGAFTDSGADAWTATVSYGGAPVGLALTAQAFTLSNTFAIAGSYTVTVTVTDDDGDAGTRSATVIVQNASQGASALAAAITDMQNDGSIPAASAATLTATLQRAAESLESKGNPSGVNQMTAFKNQVDAALNAGKISAKTAAALKAGADRIIASARN